MIDVEEIMSNLKDKPCQWLINNGQTFVRFNAQIKKMSAEVGGFEKISFTFKGNKTMFVSVDQPVTLVKDENDKMLMYSLVNDETMVLKVGYLK